MPDTRFPQVRDYDPEPPRPGLSWNRITWNALFLVDFLFGLTTKPDSEGHVVKKSRFPGWTGRRFAAVYERLAADITEWGEGRSLEAPGPVPSVEADEWSRADFDRWRVHANSPLVIKGLLRDSRAVEEWSLEWLAEAHGDEVVECIDMELEERLEEKLTVGENVPLHSVRLADFCTSDRYENFYVNNYHGLFDDEVFEEELGGKRLDELRGASRTLAQWFVSRSSTSGSQLHTANGDNLFVNVKGAKEWHFIHPDLTAYLLPALSKFAVYAVSEIGRFGLRDYEQRYREYPHLRHVPKLAVVLEEGDVLYNPPWWWHNVQNRSEFTIGCATRYMAHPAGFRSIPLFHLCQFLDLLKHPRKSVVSVGFQAVFSKNRRKNFIGSVFAGPRRDAEPQADEADSTPAPPESEVPTAERPTAPR